MRKSISPRAQQQLRNLVRETVQSEITDLQRPQHNWGQLLMGGGSPSMNTEKGRGFAGLVRCLALAGGNKAAAIEVAQKHKDYGPSSQVTKALAAGDLTAGGFMVPEVFANEVIELLRAESVVRAINPNIIEIPQGNKSFPLLQSGATAGYVGENQDIPISQAVLGEKVMSAKKLTALTVMSNELLNFSQGLAEQTILGNLVDEIAEAEDINLLRGAGTENGPLGLRHQTATAQVVASGGTTTTNIEEDFRDAIGRLTSNNVKMRRPWWIMHPTRFNHLFTLRDANGNLIFPEIRTDNPTIHRIPVKTTTNIPNNLGGGADSEIYLIEATEVNFGEVAGMEVRMSDQASYLDEASSLVSSFTRDQTVARVVLHHDIQLRHDVSMAVISLVAWGS